MLELFSNPGFVAAGGALVSAPVVIHLINRMRFKRLRWAAMEFLLKSQKRNRRRLIIEQLILLMLRCALVMLAALLVARFVGFSLAGFVGQDAMHVIVLDDTMSMNDQWKEGNDVKTCFKVARDEVILDDIVRNISQSTTNERVAIIPLSRLVTEPTYEPIIFQRLNDSANLAKLREALDGMQPSNLHVDLKHGVEKATKVLADFPEMRKHLHVLSDFRKVDWSGPDAEDLLKALRAQAADKVKIRLVDTAHPYRVQGQGGVPLSHDNLAITDMRANTRVVGKGMPVTFTVTVANYSSHDESVNIVIYDDSTGKELPQIDFNPSMPLKVPANNTAATTFEMRLFPDIPPTRKFFAQTLSARLENAQRGPLENDGLPIDNVRHAAVEVRNKVPVLVVDGSGKEGRNENGDSFFLEKAILSVPGGSYEMVYGDELVGGLPGKVLERDDLMQYPSIFLLNVRELAPKQLANLEHFVKEGGGVGFFLGPQVAGDYYTKELYRGGRGVFPAPLRSTYYPAGNQEALKPAFTNMPQMLIRSDQFDNTLRQVPIFGAVFQEPAQLEFLKDLPIRRYFQVPRGDWKLEPGRVFELATLPNEQPIDSYQDAALKLLEKMPVENPEYRQYWPALKRYSNVIRSIVAPGSDAKAYKLAVALDNMLNERGIEKQMDDYPNLTEFWSLSDPKIRTLTEEVRRLRETLLYGDPFVITQRFGNGRVVAVMSTAGKDWNDWGGGSTASVVYQPFIWEMQNYLSSQGSEASLVLGTPVNLEVDAIKWRQQGKHKLKTVRTFFKVGREEAHQVKEVANFGTEDKGLQVFSYPSNYEPGFYQTKLFAGDDSDEATELAGWGHVFNVDSQHESRLQRVSQEDLEQNLLKSAAEFITFNPPHTDDGTLINRQNDFSESAWFYLLFLAILVAEQALAVHLSFHLKGAEGEVPHVVPAQAKAA